MNNTKISPRSQGLIIIMLTVAVIAVVTVINMTVLQQAVGIFYASTVGAVLIAAIVVGANRLIHDRLVKAS